MDEGTAEDFDNPWKAMLEHAFPEFMAFYFPAAHDEIDWAAGHSFLNTELRQVVRDAELGRRFADALVEVHLLDGHKRLVYVHVEVQGQRDQALAERLFIYNYRLYDRYRAPIASLAILADEHQGWRPSHFDFEVFGCRHRLDFPMVKLLDYVPRLDELEQMGSPFAVITAAHLRTGQTRKNPGDRYQAKFRLVKMLYQHGWDRQRILDLFGIIDWMMQLPKELELELWQEIEQFEGTNMRYVTSIERIAIERGREQGIELGREQGIELGMEQGMQVGREQGRKDALAILTRILVRRFGPLSEEVGRYLDSASLEQLDSWADRILDAPSLEAVFEEESAN